MARPGRTPDSPFWVDPGAVDAAGRRLTLDPEESHHLLHVFRAGPGTAFEAVDGQGSLYRCVLEAGSGRRAAGRIESRAGRPRAWSSTRCRSAPRASISRSWLDAAASASRPPVSSGSTGSPARR
jgi:RNA methyltransferase-like protein